MSCANCKRINRMPTRRELLWEVGGGLAGVALAMLGADDAKASPTDSKIENRKSKIAQFPPRAKQVIFISLPGGLSHVDTFDYKPELTKNHGKEVQGTNLVVPFNGKRGTVMKSPWEFRPYGKSGKWVSDVLPHIGACADDLTFVHSMVSRSNAHGPALFQ